MMKTIEMPQATATQHIQSTDSAQCAQGCCAWNSYFYECQISLYCLQLLLFPCLFLGIIQMHFILFRSSVLLLKNALKYVLT